MTDSRYASGSVPDFDGGSRTADTGWPLEGGGSGPGDYLGRSHYESADYSAGQLPHLGSFYSATPPVAGYDTFAGSPGYPYSPAEAFYGPSDSGMDGGAFPAAANQPYGWPDVAGQWEPHAAESTGWADSGTVIDPGTTGHSGAQWSPVATQTITSPGDGGFPAAPSPGTPPRPGLRSDGGTLVPGQWNDEKNPHGTRQETGWQNTETPDHRHWPTSAAQPPQTNDANAHWRSDSRTWDAPQHWHNAQHPPDPPHWQDPRYPYDPWPWVSEDHPTAGQATEGQSAWVAPPTPVAPNSWDQQPTFLASPWPVPVPGPGPRAAFTDATADRLVTTASFDQLFAEPWDRPALDAYDGPSDEYDRAAVSANPDGDGPPHDHLATEFDRTPTLGTPALSDAVPSPTKDTEPDTEPPTDRSLQGTISRAERGRSASTRRRRGRPLAVMGVTVMAVAAIGGLKAADAHGPDDSDTVADGPEQPLTSPLDQQLLDLRADAENFADRASRAQARVALQERQEAQQEQARQQEEERRRREALRPKFVLPVTQHGLSAFFGSSGEHWARTHTGIDFPVNMHTPVRAATDGVVRTEYNPSYGNMVIVTAKDGTETWYCHLSRAKVRSGAVKAGDVIAYSGNTGNTTGPHLHFEVRPDGGAPINPLPWLKERGLDPQ